MSDKNDMNTGTSVGKIYALINATMYSVELHCRQQAMFPLTATVLESEP